MKNKFYFITGFTLFFGLALGLTACEKDPVAITTAPTPVSAPLSFTEEFDSVGNLAAKGWVIKNNSNPVGGSAWRQGRYETSTKYPVDFIGFPAYSASAAPTDFISCDASATSLTGNISAWLISPKMKIKNGDKISFYTRSLDDANFFFTLADHLQVRANFSNDGTIDVGNTATSTGKFSTLLFDLNPSETDNYPTGYPEVWTKFTITISGLTAPVSNARFAFRYLRTAGGINDALSAGLIGIDKLSFQSN